MYSPPMNRSTSGISAYGDGTTDTGPRYGEITECELCENERHCTDRCGMVTCRRCQADFLP